MKMDVTELGPMKRALKIEVPANEVTQRLAKAYVELNRQVNIPGFRPGKAPLAMLEKRYAKTVEEDVIRGLVPDFYDKAIRQAGIVPVHVEIPPLDRAKIKKDEPFIFTATVEIRPKIELRDYKAPSPISLKPDNRTVTDEQLDRGLEVLREQQARLEAVPAGHSIVDGDYIVLDVQGRSMEHRWKEPRKKANSTRLDHTRLSWVWKLIHMSGGKKKATYSKYPSPTQPVTPILVLPARQSYSR